jgi:hypothetical protein
VHNATIVGPKIVASCMQELGKMPHFASSTNYTIVPRIKLFSQVSHAKIIDPKNCCTMHTGIRKRLHFATSTIIKLFYTGSQVEFTCSYISQVHSATIIEPKIVALCM